METTMNKQRAAKLYELADRLSKLDVNSLSEQQRQQRSTMIAKLQEEVRTIKEFSPSEDGSENEDLYNYAKLWYNGDMSTQEDVEKALDLIGWEIGEVETEEGGAFIIKSGDENGNTYTSFTPEDLSDSENMSETVSDCTCSSKIVDPKCPVHGNAEKPALGGTGSSDSNQSLRTYMDKRAELANRKVPAMAEEFNGEYDDEAGMVQSNLRTMARAVNGLLDTIEDNDNLPEWAQEKIAKAEMMTTSVWDYLLSQKEQGIDPKVQGMSEAGFPGAPDVEMPPMKPSGDPQRDKLKQEYMDLHREIKSLVDIPYRSDSSPEQKIQAKARIKQLNDRADQIKAILEPRQPPNEWQKKTYGYDDNWNRVGKGIAETKKPSPKLTPVEMKKTAQVSEEINKEAYERLQKVFDFSNYKG
jgi:hypothetical protein